MSFTRILREVGGVILLLAVALFSLNYSGVLGTTSSFAWICFAFFSVISLISLGLSTQAFSAQKSTTSTYVFLGAMVFKFMLSLLFILTYYIFVKPTEASIAIIFLAFYLIFTAINTVYLLKISDSL